MPFGSRGVWTLLRPSWILGTMRIKLRRSNAAALCLLLAAPLAGCTDPVEELDHGVVWMKLQRGESEAENPYVGTAKIEVTLLYLECIIGFYEGNPDYQQEGVEGALVFGTQEDGGEGWKDRLCEVSNPARADCTVDSFRQELVAARQLTVTYSVEGDPEDRELPFGPLPLPELAACEGGGQPIVRVGSNGAVRGLSGSGDTIWNTEAFDPPEAFTGQGQPIGIRAARSGN
jgi:hypothetical protein